MHDAFPVSRAQNPVLDEKLWKPENSTHISILRLQIYIHKSTHDPYEGVRVVRVGITFAGKFALPVHHIDEHPIYTIRTHQDFTIPHFKMRWRHFLSWHVYTSGKCDQREARGFSSEDITERIPTSEDMELRAMFNSSWEQPGLTIFLTSRMLNITDETSLSPLKHLATWPQNAYGADF